jgi:putative ABC transport system substrate-binding protein
LGEGIVLFNIGRRLFLTTLGGAAAWPLAARAQQPALPVVGFLSGADLGREAVDAVRQGLNEAGYSEGSTVVIEYRDAGGQYSLLPALAADLVRRQVAVIVAISGVPSVLAAKAATTSIPIVFSNGGDPVALGFVSSLNRPGGNVTGATFLVNALGGKRMELLHTLVPTATTIGFLVNPSNPSGVPDTANILVAARKFGQDVHVLKASNESEIDAAFATFSQQKIDALTVNADAFFNSQRDRFAALALRYSIPAIYPQGLFAVAGGLMSYGASITDANHLAGVYAGRILKGEKPADLPVVESTKLEFVINLKTAKSLGLTVPPNLLALADEVIE